MFRDRRCFCSSRVPFLPQPPANIGIEYTRQILPIGSELNRYGCSSIAMCPFGMAAVVACVVFELVVW